MPKQRQTPIWLTAMQRGYRKRCPQCGVGELFKSWYTLHDHCASCSLPLDARDGDTWASMYITSAGITGVFLGIMIFLFRPESYWVGQFVLLPSSLVSIVGTLPRRKGMAVAFDYLTELWWNPETVARFLPHASTHAKPDRSRLDPEIRH